MLFTPLKIKNVELQNRLVVSPMCQYSSEDGFASDWHLVHLGSRAVGGAGLVFTEATGVEARGRISPQDLGIWKDEHVAMLKRIVDFLHAHGAQSGIQLAHAGRKASTAQPWKGGGALDEKDGGWRPILGPSAVAFDDNSPVPKEMNEQEMAEVTTAFVAAAKRSLDAGFRVIELHAAHGYLLHQFLSPVSNRRQDKYGGSFENRTRFPLEVVRAVRKVWPDDRPLFVRISATDWIDGESWTIDQSVEFAKILKKDGVDLIDVSSGGSSPRAKIELGAGYQTPFSEKIRREAGILTGAVGLITSAPQAETILRSGQADLIFMARQFLRDPYFAHHAAADVHAKSTWPVQYGRA